MDSGKASVLGSTGKKRKCFMHGVWVKKMVVRDEWGNLKNYQFIKGKNPYLISKKNVQIK